MIALRILDIKKMTAAFLVKGFFDEYTLIEAQITTFCTFQIDGRLESDFFGTGEEEAEESGISYIRWKMVRERCFDLIKGKRTPLAFRFVFFYPGELLHDFVSQRDVTVKEEMISGLCFNLRFDGTNLLLTTGTSMKSFTADRSCDRAWDEYILRLTEKLGIKTEQL